MGGRSQTTPDSRVDAANDDTHGLLLRWAAPAAPPAAGKADGVRDPVARAVDSLNVVAVSSALLDSQWDRLDDSERRELAQMVARRAKELHSFLLLAAAEVRDERYIDLSS